jgi:hypothetical protein
MPAPQWIVQLLDNLAALAIILKFGTSPAMIAGHNGLMRGTLLQNWRASFFCTQGNTRHSGGPRGSKACGFRGSGSFGALARAKDLVVLDVSDKGG